MPWQSLSAQAARALLEEAGVAVDAADLRVEAREERWAVRLPGERLAWLARSEAGARQMARERRVLRLLEERRRFPAPRVLFAGQDGELEVRSMVPGVANPELLQSALVASPELARRIGAAVGALLAEQHAEIRSEDAAGWLPSRPEWPQSRAWVRDRLPAVVDDPELVARADAVMEAYESIPVSEGDRVLVHGDLGPHNLAVDPESFALRGVFDYSAAAWADRHHDFRYLLLVPGRADLLEAAREAYEPAVGRPIQRSRVAVYNAACAVSFLALRIGTPAEERSCGRTLAEDLAWSREAIERALAAER